MKYFEVEGPWLIVTSAKMSSLCPWSLRFYLSSLHFDTNFRCRMHLYNRPLPWHHMYVTPAALSRIWWPFELFLVQSMQKKSSFSTHHMLHKPDSYLATNDKHRIPVCVPTLFSHFFLCLFVYYLITKVILFYKLYLTYFWFQSNRVGVAYFQWIIWYFDKHLMQNILILRIIEFWWCINMMFIIIISLCSYKICMCTHINLHMYL